ncbi:MAG: acyl-CoA dehydrogenase family protein [Variibacter sp.]
MTENVSIVAESATRIFADLADPQTINGAKDATWKVPLWRALTDAGLTLAWVPEALGGSDAGLAEGFEVIGVAGAFAASVPLVETLLAGWLLSQGGIASPGGPMTIAPARSSDTVALSANGKLSGRVRGVPFADDAEHIAVLASGAEGASIALVETKNCRMAPGANPAGDALNEVLFADAPAVEWRPAPAGFDRTAMLLMGGVARSVQTAGALGAVLRMSVAYANDRVAFERPIAKFQAIQHSLAQLAGEVAAAVAASGSAADAIAHMQLFDDQIFLEAAAAKIRSAEAAEKGAAIAHQVHGAIGFTNEHILHRFTLRMLAWRDDFGNESYWAVELGRKVAAGGADAFWPLLASR